MAQTPNTIRMNVEGMTCSHCVRTVTESLQNVPGVTAVDVSLTTGTARVEGENLDRTALRMAVEEVGYTVKPDRESGAHT